MPIFLFLYLSDCESDEPACAPLFLPEPHNETQMPETVNKRLCESQYDEPGSDYEALVQKWVSDYITTAQVIHTFSRALHGKSDTGTCSKHNCMHISNLEKCLPYVVSNFLSVGLVYVGKIVSARHVNVCDCLGSIVQP